MTVLLTVLLVLSVVSFGYLTSKLTERIEKLEKQILDLDTYAITRRLSRLELDNSAAGIYAVNKRIAEMKVDYEKRFQSISELTKDYVENFNGIGEAIDKLEDRVTKIESNGYTFVPMISNQFPPKNFDPLTDITYTTGDQPKVTYPAKVTLDISDPFTPSHDVTYTDHTSGLVDIPDSDDDKYWSIGEIKDEQEE